jgi:hypothetical protein
MNEFEVKPARSDPRRFTALLLITAASAIALGLCLRQPSQMGANDVSRWCTVWSLVERGTYVIDDCPWQIDTQDKILHATKQAKGEAGGQEPEKHFYSSKPALLPTLIAGLIYPARVLAGVPLDHVVLQERAERWTQKPDPDSPNKIKGVLETPKEPLKWPAYVFYFKPIVVLLNVVPYGVFLVLFARLLDRYSTNDWSWFFCLVAAAFGTFLLPFTESLNNHTVAAFSAFFALYQYLRIWDDRELAGGRFAVVGLFAAFAAVNELPALAFLGLVFLLLMFRHARLTALYFIPAAVLPVAGFLATQYAVFGEFRLAYESFGTDEYLWAGSIWKTPLEMDAFNEHPEPYATYLFHMTLGHHGIFSLTPIFLFSALGAARLIKGGIRSSGAKGGGAEPTAAAAWLTTFLTILVLGFYTWNPKARNYGGSTQGLRWLFWMIPFWLLMLPKGVEGGQTRGWVRGLALVALGLSVFSVGYALRNPWTHPWILDALEHLDLYPLTH